MIQPWATLFILNEAQYETRTWKTNYRGSLAIHTSKKIDNSVCNNENIQCLLSKHGFNKENLPKGMIIGVCNLINCLKVTEDAQGCVVLEDGRIVSGNDYLLGDFRVGNYVWEVSNKEMLINFIPAKGKLGLWEYDLN
ncbi:2-oxoglutarate dehydrogenase E1 [Psychrobacillus sp. PGGUH221]|uniref:2-oxoglutarate dehydrogenase E1 n=1 Tax=Psychrobacillus sp. PGGUH221 TaxID=3020058 RepID=UPI0035C7100E